MDGHQRNVFPPELPIAISVFKPDQAVFQRSGTIANPHQIAAFIVNVTAKGTQYRRRAILFRCCN
jgi:hypothetical protein